MGLRRRSTTKGRAVGEARLLLHVSVQPSALVLSSAMKVAVFKKSIRKGVKLGMEWVGGRVVALLVPATKK